MPRRAALPVPVILPLAVLLTLACSDGPFEEDPFEENPSDTHEFGVTVLRTMSADADLQVGTINGSNQVTWNESGEGRFWDGNTIVTLPLTAWDLGPEGQVIGTGGDGRILLWADGSMVELAAGGEPLGIVDSDGSAAFRDSEGRIFFRHPSGTVEEWTGPYPENGGGVAAVGEDGSVLGQTFFEEGEGSYDVYKCFVSRDGEVVLMGGDRRCTPVTATETGLVIYNQLSLMGGVWDGVTDHSFEVWIESREHQSVGTGTFHSAFGINDAGTLVGGSNVNEAILVRDRVAMDLDSLRSTDTWPRAYPVAISDAGWILALGDDLDGTRAILLFEPR